MKEKAFNFVTILKNDDKSLTNRDGLTPFFALANSLSLGMSKIGEDRIIQSILDIDLDEINDVETNTLISFIHHSKIKTEKIITQLLTAINKSLSNDKDILKRALVIRFIIEVDKTKFSIKQLRDEKKIYEKYRWLWLDAAIHYDWELVKYEIADLISEGNYSKELIMRLPYYKKTMGSEELIEALKLWRLNTTEEIKQKLEKTAASFNVKLAGLSLNAIELIDNVSLLQESII